MNTNFESLARTAAPAIKERRSRTRIHATIPGRIIWRDARGTLRFSSVLTRDVSEQGAFVECLSGPPIPMHRLVHLQIDRANGTEPVPTALKQGKVLAAVSHIGPVSRITGLPDGYGLRLLVEPTSQVVTAPVADLVDASLALPA